jgi:hypothetical protein
MDDLRKIHVTAGWVLTGGGVAMMLINAVNASSVICLIVGIGLLVYAKRTHA